MFPDEKPVLVNPTTGEIMEVGPDGFPTRIEDARVLLHSTVVTIHQLLTIPIPTIGMNMQTVMLLTDQMFPAVVWILQHLHDISCPTHGEQPLSQEIEDFLNGLFKKEGE